LEAEDEGQTGRPLRNTQGNSASRIPTTRIAFPETYSTI
jgi:hypothetical protein